MLRYLCWLPAVQLSGCQPRVHFLVWGVFSILSMLGKLRKKYKMLLAVWQPVKWQVRWVIVLLDRAVEWLFTWKWRAAHDCVRVTQGPEASWPLSLKTFLSLLFYFVSFVFFLKLSSFFTSLSLKTLSLEFICSFSVSFSLGISEMIFFHFFPEFYPLISEFF